MSIDVKDVTSSEVSTSSRISENASMLYELELEVKTAKLVQMEVNADVQKNLADLDEKLGYQKIWLRSVEQEMYSHWSYTKLLMSMNIALIAVVAYLLFK